MHDMHMSRLPLLLLLPLLLRQKQQLQGVPGMTQQQLLLATAIMPEPGQAPTILLLMMWNSSSSNSSHTTIITTTMLRYIKMPLGINMSSFRKMTSHTLEVPDHMVTRGTTTCPSMVPDLGLQVTPLASAGMDITTMHSIT